MNDGQTNDGKPDDRTPDDETPPSSPWRPTADDAEPNEPWWAAPTVSPATTPATPPPPSPVPPAAVPHTPPAPPAPFAPFAPPAAAPSYGQPSYGQPYGSQPAFGQQPFGAPRQPPYSAPTYGEPTYGESTYGAPAYGQPGGAGSSSTMYGSTTSSGRRNRSRNRNHGWPSLVIVAVIAALVGAVVASAVVATNKNNDDKSSSNALSSPSTQSAPAVVASLPAGSVASVASALLPSVVSITVSGRDEQDEGTGIILSDDGQILTNNHVVEAAATSGVIAVTFSNGKTVTASIVGRDPTSDLAVIKAAGVTGLHPATLGSDASLAVGQQVVAVGSPLGLSNTVTSGIISSLNRPVCTQNCGGSASGATPTVLDAIQTDAAINPGNSGGPLVDMAGRVVGINSAIATLDQSQGDSQSGNIGVGFAIPIDEAKRIVTQLQKTGHADHALFGIGVADSVDGNLNTPNGAKIVSITPDGPAAKAGLKVNDIVVKFGDRPLIDADSLIAATHAAVPNSTVTITYVRGGQQATVQVTLGAASSG
jgi:putative serine protease PepD